MVSRQAEEHEGGQRLERPGEGKGMGSPVDLLSLAFGNSGNNKHAISLFLNRGV